MKCLYYLSPDLLHTREISEDLRAVGVSDWFLSIISRDRAGLRREQLNGSNYFETRDILREGLIGAALGFVASLALAALVMVIKPFGATTPALVYPVILVVFTLFGAWVGGLIGVDSENKKLRRFSDDIAAGKYLILIYAFKEQEDVIRQMMKDKHPDVRLAAVDRQFLNPFSAVRKRRPGATAGGAASDA